MSEGLDRLERIARSISEDALLGPVMRACPLPGDQEGDLHPFETRNIHPDLPSKVRSLFDDGYGEQSVFEAFKFVEKEVKRLFVDLVGSDTRGVMGGVYGSRSPRIRSANH
jgi:hypothetical protein